MPGRIRSLNFSVDDYIQKGQLLMEIEAPELEFELSQVQHHLEELQYEQAATGIDAEARARSLISASELETQRQRLASLIAQISQLAITAQQSGVVKDIDPSMQVGTWVANATPLFSLMNSEIQDVYAYSGEAELGRLEVGQSGTFYPEGGGREPFEVQLTEIDYFGVTQLEQLYSASVFGGDVAVRETPAGELIPSRAIYRIHLNPVESTMEERVIRGTVKIAAFRRSLAGRAWRFLAATLIRESSF